MTGGGGGREEGGKGLDEGGRGKMWDEEAGRRDVIGSRGASGGGQLMEGGGDGPWPPPLNLRTQPAL